jgi:hypothetical protein
MMGLAIEDALAEIDRYFEELETTVDAIDACLTAFRQKTAVGQFDAFEPIISDTIAANAALETMLDRRGALLLRLASDQFRPKTLRIYLREFHEYERLRTAENLAARIEQQRRLSIAVFTAQYWHFDATRDIVRIITSPGPNAGTYGTKVYTRGGGLLDEAA